ncbi:MAG: ABC transporter permease [bacterium]
MFSFAYRILRSQPLRMGLTVGGMALCIILMLFLMSIYHGVADGSVEYVRQTKADLWVLQEGTTNILRGFSILSTGHGNILRTISGIESVSPLLFLLTTITKGTQSSTVYVAGYDLATGIGAPPQLKEGRSLREDDEIILDRAFALKNSFVLGNTLVIRNDTLKIVGISEQTNMFVLQYAFVSIAKARALAGFSGLTSCFLVTVKNDADLIATRERIKNELPGTEVFCQREFVENNIREMQSGFLPLLYTLALIGAVVLTTILSLILTITILEKRKDFAVMKILGSPRSFLSRLILTQGFEIALASCITALVFFFPLIHCVEVVSPEVSTKTSLEQIVVIVVAALGMNLVSSFLSYRQLRRIYPMEVYLS